MTDISLRVNKKLLGGNEKVRVAAIQASQIVFNKDKSIDKAVKMMKKAGAKGAKLVAFSETYLPAYPAYYTCGFESPMGEWMTWIDGLQDNSIVIPSEDTDIIGEACKEADVYCVMGVNELDNVAGSRTLYNTQIMFGKDGTVMGKRRKLIPTYTERAYWGCGDGSDLKVYDTNVGRVGSLICYEHHTILVRAAQMLMGEELHVANWPGTWRLGPTLLVEGSPKTGICDLEFAAREYAFESGAFVINVNGLLREEDFEPSYKDFAKSSHMNYKWAIGGSFIVDPFGNIITEPIFGKETIIYADCYAKSIKAAKTVFDGLGHYSRPDVTQLLVRTHPWRNVQLITEAPPEKSHSEISPELAKIEKERKKLKKLLSEYENQLKKMEKKEKNEK
ncbi:MAG: carbon-nitrogen hydrolase family protein [Candidatus Bathyarchaeota archaeon]